MERTKKNLENLFIDMIGNEILPEIMVFGNERAYQKEADIFAVGENGELVIIELKVDGNYERGKVLQAMEYSQLFSTWQYDDMDTHFKKCFRNSEELLNKFEEHFNYRLDKSRFNLQQKIIVISNGSSQSVRSAVQYWKFKGVNIEEYFYRFYTIENKNIFELSNELYSPATSSSCWINTCKTHFENVYLDMVKNSKASTYGNRTNRIGEWMSGGYIFLYHNGYGIIGGGKGTNKIKEKRNEEINDDEKFIKLKDFIHGVNIESKKIEKYISPTKLKDALGQNFWFANTKVSLTKEMGEKLYALCEKVFV